MLLLYNNIYDRFISASETRHEELGSEGILIDNQLVTDYFIPQLISVREMTF